MDTTRDEHLPAAIRYPVHVQNELLSKDHVSRRAPKWWRKTSVRRANASDHTNWQPEWQPLVCSVAVLAAINIALILYGRDGEYIGARNLFISFNLSRGLDWIIALIEKRTRTYDQHSSERAPSRLQAIRCLLRFSTFGFLLNALHEFRAWVAWRCAGRPMWVDPVSEFRLCDLHDWYRAREAELLAPFEAELGRPENIPGAVYRDDLRPLRIHLQEQVDTLKRCIEERHQQMSEQDLTWLGFVRGSDFITFELRDCWRRALRSLERYRLAREAKDTPSTPPPNLTLLSSFSTHA